ncbi:MAG: hypothetical protein LQ346_001644 [Caloplaca aetnensis]|nr:MAG: hypothetical protein LQ346_001644 [Caloplaca aetnensis]
MHIHVALCQGLPGTRKTTVITLLAHLCLSLGFAVYLGASTSLQADQLADKMNEILISSPDAEVRKIKATRVYRPMHERGAAEKTPMAMSEAAVEASLGELDRVQMIGRVLTEVKQQVRNENSKRPDLSLQARTFQFAEDAHKSGHKLMGTYSSKDEEDPQYLYEADTGALDKSQDSPSRTSAAKVDYFEVLYNGKARRETKSINEWEAGRTRQYLKSNQAAKLSILCEDWCKATTCPVY